MSRAKSINVLVEIRMPVPTEDEVEVAHFEEALKKAGSAEKLGEIALTETFEDAFKYELEDGDVEFEIISSEAIYE